MKTIHRVLSAAALSIGLASTASAVVITKAPDFGPFWQPLSSTGTYVYADSFVATTSGVVTDLGWWFVTGGSNYVLEILGNGATGPDGSNVLGKTAVHSDTAATLSFVDYAPTTPINVVAGQTYWFAASTVGNLGGTGGYQVGGHTQNSGGIVDNGTFWYSNDSNGLTFDGANLTPEMAFSVTINGDIVPPSGVPEPTPLLLLGAGLVGAVVARRRKARAA